MTDAFDHAVGLHRAGRSAEAEEICAEILAHEPAHARALHLLGAIRFAAGARDAAVTFVEQALAAKPDYAEAEFNLAAMLAALGRDDDAARHYARAAELRPEHAEAWARLGAVLMNLGRAAPAEDAYRRALALRPDDASVLSDLSMLARRGGRLDEAVELGRRAVAAAPDLAAAQLRLARSLTDRGESEDAQPHYRRAVQLAPEDIDYRRALRLNLLYLPNVDARDLWAEQRAFGQAAAARVGQRLPPPDNLPDPQRRLRVGWLSSDFRDHPVARNIEPVFLNRDRRGFEFICYADGETTDAMTERFRGTADAWRPISGLGDAEVAALIRADRVDVMMYLAGHYDRNRPHVAAWRPAPVQISYDDQASSGVEAMDYLVADPVLAPRTTAEQFSERVLCLPRFYVQQPPTSAPDVGPLPAARAGRVTFGCLNNPAKLNRHVLAVWGEILRRLPEARLRFKYTDRFASVALRDTVRRAIGVADAQLEFDPDPAWSIGYYNAVDIALDPFPFSGAATTFEALWMGVPTVTLCGATIAGRQSVAMLRAIGLDDLIAPSREAYVEAAVALARDTQRLTDLRAGLRARVAGSSLCAGALFTRRLERMLRAVWRTWCRAQRGG